MEYAGTFWAISRGENVGEKKKWFSYGVTWAHKKTKFVFGMANIHSGRKVYCLLQATVNTLLFLCSHTGKRLGTQDWPEGWKMDPQIGFSICDHFSWALGHFPRQTRLKWAKNFKARFLSLTKCTEKGFWIFATDMTAYESILKC